MKPPSINQKSTSRAPSNSRHSGASPRYPMARADIIPSSPKVKNVTKERGFIPDRYALRYGIYMVPHRTPAPSAAQTPRMEWAAGAWVEDAMASKAAPTHMTRAPPSTPVQRRQPAWRSSLKKMKPQSMPRRLLEFQRGNAMLKPISRMAKMVMVLATAQRHPARRAQMMR